MARAPGPALGPPEASDLSALKAWRQSVHAAWLEGDPAPEACGHWSDEVGGVACLRASGPTGDSPTIVYFHGGGYCLGSPTVSIPITERLSAGTNIISVEYRLAPEHPFPAAIDDAAAVYAGLIETRLRQPTRGIVLAGDSAGANIALSLALTHTHLDLPAPDGLVLLSPHLDHGRTPLGHERRATDDVDAAMSIWLTDAYRGGRPAIDSGISPLRAGDADLAALPPTLIQVGTIDTSFTDGTRLAHRLRSLGVPVELDVWGGLWHTWHYHRDLPEADEALRRALAFCIRVTE